MYEADALVGDNYSYDLAIIHPWPRGIYSHLEDEFAAVEPPLWVRLIGGYIRDQRYSVAVIDQEAEQLNDVQVAARVFSYRPRVVAIVAYGHQPSASTQQMVGVRSVAKAVRTVTPAKIIIVGGHVSALPERTLKEESVDYACVGEGPLTILGLLQEKVLGEIPGLVWRDSEQKAVKNMPAMLLEPYFLRGSLWDKLPLQRYRAHNWQCFGDISARQPYASIYTSLGCPFKCHFCCINAPFGNSSYRLRSPVDVVEEVDRLYRYDGVKTFKIIDEMFVLNPKHYVAIAEGLSALPFADDLNFWAYARVDTVKEGHLALLRKAGIRWLALGIESASQYVRDGADKRYSNEDIAEVVRAVQKAGINVIANYIFGLPDDDLNSMRATLQMACDLNTEFANFYSAMAYPGSPLYQQALSEGWKLPETWAGYSQHSYETYPLRTKHVDAATVLKFRDEAFDIYFTRPDYLDMLLDKFGIEAVEHVQRMTKSKLKRRLLEDTYAPKERVSSH
jgi:anaerobic magnesium-protoporphyrin IX monomethyl ester cyclase